MKPLGSTTRTSASPDAPSSKRLKRLPRRAEVVPTKVCTERWKASWSAAKGVLAALSAPHIVQSVWDRIRTTRPDLSEPEVVLPMRNLAGLWQQLFPAEQGRLAQLLIERVVIADGGLEIIWRDHGWQELAGELMPGTIGAELQEWERQEVEA